MFRRKQIQKLLEARVNEHKHPVAGRKHFVNELRCTLGLMEEVRDAAGNTTGFARCEDEHGRPLVKAGAASPEEFSLKELARAICGEQLFEDVYDPAGGADALTLLESAGGPGVDPTAFLNISTVNLAVAGLVEAKIIQRFQNPQFIGDQFVEVRSTRKNGDKMIGITAIGDKSLTRAPGQAHPRAGFGEQWVKTPETVERALAVDVMQEAVFFDLTGDVLTVAGSVGDELGYRREKDIIDMVLGVTNTYSYKDTTYNTFQSSTPWINTQSKPFDPNVIDWPGIDSALQLFQQMTDPATGKEILVMPDTVLVMPARRGLAESVFGSAATVIEGSAIAGNYPARLTQVQNPINRLAPQLANRIFTTPIARTRAIAADGLNLSASNADKRWYVGQPSMAFAWMENWPLRVRQASANEYIMLDRGLVASYFADYRGVGAVKEPRYWVQNTH